jgi:DNA transposition AAA+ family ATPase
MIDGMAEAPRTNLSPTEQDATRVVRDAIVTVAKREYAHPIFLELEGRTVAVRPVNDDYRQLHVFVDGRWAGDAYLNGIADVNAKQRHAVRYDEDEQGSLEGARLVETENYLLCEAAIAAGAEDMEIVACYGEAGLGKSYVSRRACIAHAERLGMRHIRIVLRQSTSGGALVAALIEQLFDVHRVRPSANGALFALLLDGLAEPTLVHVDEAQYLQAHAMHLIRHIVDLSHIPVSFVLSGGNTFWKVLSSDPMLKNRVPHRVPVRRFSKDEIPTVIRAFHPMFEAASDEQLVRLDDIYAHGVFRDWRHLARQFQRYELDPGEDGDHDKVLIRLGIRARG